MKAVVSLSGGMDSATVLAKALHEGRRVYAVGFYYGSKHNEFENAQAEKLADALGADYELIDISGVMKAFQSDLLLSGGDIPEGHYTDASMSATVVPGRNMIFASILTGYAWSIGAEEVWMGVHAGDHAIYPDCRPDFVGAMNLAIKVGTDDRVKLVTPYLHVTKKEILKDGYQMAVPYSLTRTCYKHQELSCGKCGSCVERLEAFESLGMVDPVPYERIEHD